MANIEQRDPNNVNKIEMIKEKQAILVLGAGVSGLSTGILLLKTGYPTTIWAKDLPPNTTSDKAAAVWYPYLCNPREKAILWSKATFDYFVKEIINDPNSGCIRRKTIEVFTEKKEEPWWKDSLPNYSRPRKENLPEGYVDGYEIDGIVIDTEIYMQYLINIFKKLGGTIVQKTVSNIQEALENYNLAINCTGLGSKELFSDKAIYPVRGQMVKIKPNGFDKVVADAEGPNSLTIIVPRINDIMLGGTAQVNDWNLEVDPKDTEDILKKAANLYPEFKEVQVVSESVGLRPVRDEIRLRDEDYSGKTVIHNYGHGGSGFTLSWGCAQNVVDLVEKVLSSQAKQDVE